MAHKHTHTYKQAAAICMTHACITLSCNHHLVDVPCQGIYDRKYTPLHGDRTAGVTTAKKLWNDDGREKIISYIDSNKQFMVDCTCCASFQQWKKIHPVKSRQLKQIADKPLYYRIYPNEKLTLPHQPHYVGTIRALPGAPMGECGGIASSTGFHPYTCIACNALIHGKTSVLNRKLVRCMTLKNPRSNEDHASKVGVSHKYCSAQH